MGSVFNNLMENSDVDSAVAEEIMTPYVIMLDIDAKFEALISIMREKRISAIFIHDSFKNDYYIIS